jgi:hypothetical protein
MEDIQHSQNSVQDLYGPDLETAQDELIEFIHPCLKSDIDGATTIYTTHESLEHEATYWTNVGHKAHLQARHAQDLNALTTDRLAHDLTHHEAAPGETQVARTSAQNARFNLNHMTQLREVGLEPIEPPEPPRY